MRPSPAVPSAAVVVVAAALVSAGCSRDWRTDMWYQPSLRAEDAPRPEPPDSVPLGAESRYEDRDDTEELSNPVPPSPVSVARGKALFLERCAPCHGREGHGGGPVSRFFPAAPDLAYLTVRQRSDGFIWGTITYGGRAMPSQREGLTARDRWNLVNYVRAIQGKP
jgi:mono/diheme cytochrome c family protein